MSIIRPPSHIRPLALPLHLTEQPLQDSAPTHPQSSPLAHPVTLTPDDGATTLPDRAAFERFAARDDVPGAIGVREVKFVIVDADSNAPAIYFMNSSRHAYHYYFARDFLGVLLPNAAFNRVTYFTDNRRFIVGTIIAHDSYTRPDGSPGLYALEFWPTDPVSAPHVIQSMRLLKHAMPFAAEQLVFHPSGDLQEQLFAREADLYAAAAIRTVSTTELFEGITYSPLNLGVAVGRLRIITGADAQPPRPTDIVIYDTLPNDLPLVAGVITQAPQTPLSHVNLRARQNGIANAYLRDALTAPDLTAFLGKNVHLAVTSDQIEIRAATADEVAAALSARRPRYVQRPPRDLGPRAIVALNDLAWGDVDAFGAKATNLAELRRTINPKYVPDGFAVPFSFYDTFMQHNEFYGAIAAEIASSAFADDTQRPARLKNIRSMIKKGEMPDMLRTQLGAMHAAFPPGTNPRCRSSANAEDMVGFTGAGLYDSYTHRPDEGHIEKSIKQVWASLWTFRAYEEREFYRIDHFAAAMGVLVHPNFDDELVNGVALTHNTYFPGFDGYYVNAQVGEDLITNPEGTQTAEEVLILKELNPDRTREYEMIYVRRSSLVAEGETVLSRHQLLELTKQMQLIQTHFQTLYHRADGPDFAMDIEFKIDRDGQLAIKQARPWAG